MSRAILQPAPGTIFSASAAQAVQDADPQLVWIVLRYGLDFVAIPHIPDNEGGKALPFILTARTLPDLHKHLPRGLKQGKRLGHWAPETMEMWSA